MNNNIYKTIGLAVCLAVMSSASLANFVVSERVSELYFIGTNFDTEVAPAPLRHSGLAADRVVLNTNLMSGFNHQLKDSITVDPIESDPWGPNTGHYDVSQNTVINSNFISSSASAFSTAAGESSPYMLVSSWFEITFKVNESTDILLEGELFNGPSTVETRDDAVLALKKGTASIFSVYADDPQHSFPIDTDPADFSFLVTLDPNYTYTLISRISAEALNGDIQTAQSSFTLTAVPVPTALWLFGSGLIGFVGLRRQTA